MPSAFDEIKQFKELEASARRSPTADILHPDQCPKLKIKGAVWAIPQRGQRLVPKFSDDGFVELSYPATEEWPEVLAVLQAIKLPDEPVCPSCGQPTATDFEATDELMSALFALAAKALRTQYDLSPANLSALLGFSADETPEWINTLIKWCAGDSSASSSAIDPLAGDDGLFGLASQLMMPPHMAISPMDATATHTAGKSRRRRRRRKRPKRKLEA